MHSTLTEGLQGASKDAPSEAFLIRAFDADHPIASTHRHALSGLDEVIFGRAEAHRSERKDLEGRRTLTLGVADRWMSGQHAKLSRVLRTWVLEDTKSKNGVRCNGVPITRLEVHDGDLVELGRTFFVIRLNQPCASEVNSDALATVPAGLRTLSPSLEARFAEVQKLAVSAVSIALGGPSGSGKEVVARAIHTLSARGGPLVAVNCGALPDELVESELFGHKKGAFSGAIDDKAGLVRASSGGTLLLDEVGDLPLEAQPALLRVLQERQVVPVGGTAPLPVDLRVISATHRALESLAAGGLFRDDLRARLSGYSLTLPALSERREDMGLLVSALLTRVAPQRASTVSFTIAAARALFSATWPLNIRELEKALEAAVVLAGASPLDLPHFPSAIQAPRGRAAATADDETADASRKAELEKLLTEHAGNVSAVARAMGKARMQIQRWMARFGLDPRQYRS